MNNRKRIGIKFEYNDQWIGGTYYFLNLIQVLKRLDVQNQPMVVIFSKISDYTYILQQTSYQFLEFVDLDKKEISFLQKIANRFFYIFSNRVLFKKKYKGEIDVLLLMKWNDYFSKVSKQKLVYWIPDFQHKYFPEFYSAQGLSKIENNILWISKYAKKVIFSSADALNDWKNYYPKYNGINQILKFAVTHPEFDSLDKNEVKRKYQIDNEYIMVPNQFWQHKNHFIVILAAEHLKKLGKSKLFVLCGKENDDRNPDYVINLKNYVNKNNLDDVVKFLGFIDRREQLKLMSESEAILQPSKFEGWSTVIEDAMRMNKVIIASDLSVNREQLGLNGIYFKMDDYLDLSDKVINLDTKTIDFNYNMKMNDFLEGIMKLF